jgi:hypothetical protein
MITGDLKQIYFSSLLISCHEKSHTNKGITNLLTIAPHTSINVILLEKHVSCSAVTRAKFTSNQKLAQDFHN